MISQACDTELRTSPLGIGTNNGRWASGRLWHSHRRGQGPDGLPGVSPEDDRADDGRRTVSVSRADGGNAVGADERRVTASE